MFTKKSVAVTDLFPPANQCPRQAIRPHTDQSGTERIDSLFLSKTIFLALFGSHDKSESTQLSPVFSYGHSTWNTLTEDLNLQLVGPWPVSQGFTYLMTCIDSFTRVVWSHSPKKHFNWISLGQALMSGWISRYGVPTTITTDRGRQFESHLFLELSRIKRTHTTNYHPCF